MTLDTFSFKVPSEIIFGVGKASELPGILHSKGLKRILLVSDHGLETVGLVNKITQILDEGVISYVSYLDIEANPSTETVEKGVYTYNKINLRR